MFPSIRKPYPFLLAPALCLSLSACTDQSASGTASATESAQAPASTSVEQQKLQPASQKPADVKPPTVLKKPVDAKQQARLDAQDKARTRAAAQRQAKEKQAKHMAAPAVAAKYPGIEPKDFDGETMTGGVLFFGSEVVDFGKKWDFESMQHEYEFMNKGNETLNIKNIKASCGCTATTLDKKIFAPGESDSIRVNWKPKGKGAQRKTITVSSDSAIQPTRVLELKAELQEFVVVTPKNLRLGDLEQHVEHTAVVYLTPATKDFVVTKVQTNNKNLSAAVTGKDETGRHILTVTIGENAPWGNLIGRINVTGTGTVEGHPKPVTHTVLIQLIAKMYGDITMQPEMFRIGAVAGSRPLKSEVKLYHKKNQPFQVTSARILHPRPQNLTVRWEPFVDPDGRAGQKMIVEAEPSNYKSHIRGTVMFRTDLGGAEEQQIQIYGTMR